jgi:hypothetical protein
MQSQQELAELLLIDQGDGQKFEANRTGIALTNGQRDAATYQALLRALAQQSIFIKVFDDSGPARVREQLAAFDAGPDARAIALLRPSLLANATGEVGEAQTKRWRDAPVARNVIFAAAVATTLEELLGTTEALRESARWRLLIYFATGVLALILVLGMNCVVGLARCLLEHRQRAAADTGRASKDIRQAAVELTRQGEGLRAGADAFIARVRASLSQIASDRIATSSRARRRRRGWLR